MSEAIRVVRRGVNIPQGTNGRPIPDWFDDPERVGPCPCGQPIGPGCLLIEGPSLKRWFHQGCLDFLEHEMDEEEIEEKHEWEQRMRELQEGSDDDE